jgi:hypothetical protein
METADRRRQLASIGVVLVFAALGLAGLWKFGGFNRDFFAHQREVAQQQRAASGLSDEEVERLVAWSDEYVQAVQRRDCEQVIATTLWMQDRLEYVREHAAQPAVELEAAREALCEDLRHVPEGRDVLSDAGADDAALFRPTADVELVAIDPGRQDLESPAAGRVWLRIHYPSPGDALAGADGRRIKTARVGLTFSPEGRVIKAGVLGNAELDTESEPVYW